ncbi:MAG: hypothetical protein LBJ83_00275 [Oscillospiraceae bacterium]|nr:hypothetical protein [Oscillospiraceae bacterium]
MPKGIGAAGRTLKLNLEAMQRIADDVSRMDTSGAHGAEIMFVESGSGIIKLHAERLEDHQMEGQLRSQNAMNALFEIQQDAMSRVLNLLGNSTMVVDPANPRDPVKLAACFSDFNDALIECRDDDTAPGVKEKVLIAAQQLCFTFNEIIVGIERITGQVEQKIAADVAKINDLLHQIRRIDDAIVTTWLPEVPPVNLEDERDRLLDQLREIIPFETEFSSEEPNGPERVVLRLEGGPLLDPAVDPPRALTQNERVLLGPNGQHIRFEWDKRQNETAVEACLRLFCVKPSGEEQEIEVNLGAGRTKVGNFYFQRASEYGGALPGLLNSLDRTENRNRTLGPGASQPLQRDLDIDFAEIREMLSRWGLFLATATNNVVGGGVPTSLISFGADDLISVDDAWAANPALVGQAVTTRLFQNIDGPHNHIDLGFGEFSCAEVPGQIFLRLAYGVERLREKQKLGQEVYQTLAVSAREKFTISKNELQLRQQRFSVTVASLQQVLEILLQTLKIIAGLGR